MWVLCGLESVLFKIHKDILLGCTSRFWTNVCHLPKWKMFGWGCTVRFLVKFWIVSKFTTISIYDVLLGFGSMYSTFKKSWIYFLRVWGWFRVNSKFQDRIWYLSNPWYFCLNMCKIYVTVRFGIIIFNIINFPF